MNFVITCDEYVLHDDRSQIFRVGSPKLNLELNKNGTLKFIIYPEHPYYNNIRKMQSLITVYQNGNIIFKGRVLEDAIDIYKSKSVVVEGIFAYFLDSIYRPFSYQGSVSDFLEDIILNHNSQVEDFQKFKLGTVTVTDPNDYIIRNSIYYLTSYEILRTRLFESTLGGYMRIRYEQDGNYIDYLADFSDTSTQTIEFAKNIVDLEHKITGSEIMTGIIPLGAKLSDDDGNQTDERLTIKSVNDNKDYLIDSTLAETYGRIFKVVEWDDVTLPNILKTKGQAYLDSHKFFSDSFQVSAVDLNAVSSDINYFKVGQYVRIKSQPHDLNTLYLLKKMNMDIENPANTVIELGWEKSSLTDLNINQNNKTNDVTERVETIETHYVPNTLITGIVNEEIQNSSIINQLPNEIMTLVEEDYTKQTDFQEYQTQISTQMSQSASEITLQFENVTSMIQTLGNETSQQFSDIVKYIRFVDGNIILGQVDNPFLLKISNNRISFLENNSEVAYMSNGKLYITDGEFLNFLQLGNFVFSPRANGNLSFFKNKG